MSNEIVASKKEVSKNEEMPIFSIEILKIIKRGQQRHGLKYNDYLRYRDYCTRRIRRLRRVLHLEQIDQRYFCEKNMTETDLSDERAVYISLMLAERAWSIAMQLRVEANTEPRKKKYLVSSLKKVTRYAEQLERLCDSEKFDSCTEFQARAYAHWCKGMLQLEKKKWVPAILNFKIAQKIYVEIASTLNEEDAILYENRIEELEAYIRDFNLPLHLYNQAQKELELYHMPVINKH